MTLLEIDVFLTVVRTGSISQASKRLFLTQPAVSRHLNALENEVGAKLLFRERGRRNIELTDRGKVFLESAIKLKASWQETLDALTKDSNKSLSAGCIESISSYIFNSVIDSFLSEDPNRSLEFFLLHSSEAYEQVASAKVDIAIISDDIYHPEIETIPLFKEPMVLLSKSGFSEYVNPKDLDCSKEIRLPWNPEYDLWHSYWFSNNVKPRLVTNQMSILEEIFTWSGVWNDSWAIAPYIVAKTIAEKTDAKIFKLKEGPSDEIIYYITKDKRKYSLIESFLNSIRKELSNYKEIVFF